MSYDMQATSNAIPMQVAGADVSATARAAELQKVTAPFSITVTSDERTARYSEATKAATLNAIRADILQGALQRDASTTTETTAADGKTTTQAGTLFKCASRYPQISALYKPVRRDAKAGLGIGILAGILLCIVILGINVFRVNETYGALILALVAGPFVIGFMAKYKGDLK